MVKHNFDTRNPIQLNFFGLLAILLPIVAIIGNWAVILSVRREKGLQTSTNFLIVSLAVADLLVGLIVMPWGIFALVSSQWTLPYVICDIYMTMDVICSTASIFNLVAISLDRYRAIKHPMEYSQTQASGNHRLIFASIFLIWGIAVAVGLPILFGLNNREATYEDGEDVTCEFHNPDFIICSSILSFYIPCIIIIFIYVSVYKMILERDKAKKAKMNMSTIPVKDAKNPQTTSNKRTFPPKKLTLTITSNQPDLVQSQLEVPDKMSCHPLLNQESDEEEERKSDKTRMKRISEDVVTSKSVSVSTQVDLNRPCKKEKKRSMKVSFSKTNNDISLTPESSNEATTTNNEAEIDTSNETAPPTPVEKMKKRMKVSLVRTFSEGSILGDVSNRGGGTNPANSRRSLGLAASAKILTRAANWRAKSLQAKTERRERRATKTLAIVLGCFLVCWIPFFTCNIFSAISIKFELPNWRPSINVFLITTWLGYINSILNPIIYTIFNMEFRKAFKKIFGFDNDNNGEKMSTTPSTTTGIAARVPTNARV